MDTTMRERELQSQVEALADGYGLMWHNCRDSRWCEGHSGFPDLVIVGLGGVIFAELKSWTGRMSPDQTMWRYALECTGALFYLWNPTHLMSGAIDTVLHAIATA